MGRRLVAKRMLEGAAAEGDIVKENFVGKSFMFDRAAAVQSAR